MENELDLVDEYSDLAALRRPRLLLDRPHHGRRGHHPAFSTKWRNAIQADAELREVEPQVPHLSRSADPEKVKSAVRRFRKLEEADAEGLGIG